MKALHDLIAFTEKKYPLTIAFLAKYFIPTLKFWTTSIKMCNFVSGILTINRFYPRYIVRSPIWYRACILAGSRVYTPVYNKRIRLYLLIEFIFLLALEYPFVIKPPFSLKHICVFQHPHRWYMYIPFFLKVVFNILSY